MFSINKEDLKNNFAILFKLFLLYFLLVEIFRTTFIIYYYDKLSKINLSFFDALPSYTSGFKVDIAMASYFLIVPWLLVLFNTLFKSKIIKIILIIYTMILISLSSFIYIAELGVYNEWEEKPSFGILTYLKHPTEPFQTNPIEYTIILSIVLILVLSIMYKVGKIIFSSYNVKTKRNFISTMLIFFSSLIIFLGVRGGTSSAPISQSDAYFSKHKILNDIAVNTPYNFFASIEQNYTIISGENIYKTTYTKEQKAKSLRVTMPQDDNATYPRLLTTNRPNIIIILMESVSGDFITTQKYRDLIPNIMKLSKQGIFFPKAYAAGTLSHEGVPSIFSGFPAISDIYITNLPSKFNKLPSINESLKPYNYDSMFLYGGQLRYGNLASYIYKNEFNIVEEGKHLSPSLPRGRMGVPDGPMLKYFMKKTSTLKEPFFSSMFTLSSHAPYDQPMDDIVNWNSNEDKYLNSVIYTDKSIGEFIKDSKKEPWFKNTLFIFASDHSHATPYGWSRNKPNWHHIVMFMYGEVIKKEYRGYKFDKIVSQSDIAATLLAQLNIEHKEYLWSRNVFSNSYIPNSYYTVGGGGFGFIDKNSSVAYGLKQKNIIYKKGDIKESKKNGAIYVENLLETYLNF